MDNKYVNSFDITGTVIFAYQKNKAVFISLATSPFGHVDYPFVIIFNNKRDKIVNVNKLKKGTRLTVKGYVSTNKSFFYGSLIVTEAKIEKNRQDLKFDDIESYVADKNIVKLKGLINHPAREVTNDKNDEVMARFNVQTLTPNGRKVYPVVVSFYDAAEKILKLPAKSAVACLCFCQTKIIDGRNVHSFVAQSIETLE